VLGQAVKKGTLARNVAAIAGAPKAESAEIAILEPEQVAPVLAALKGHRLYPIAVLAIHTGLRRGELLALQCGDVDLEGGTVMVRRALEQTKHGIRVKEPKTKKSRRTVALSAEAIDALRTHRAEMASLALAIGRPLPDTAFVFCNVEGRPISPDTLSGVWRRACDARGLPRVRFHDLGHTHASLLIAQGVDVLTVAKRLGHSKATTTLNIYGHALERADREAAEAFSMVVKGEKLK
jgi:integrase